jgi:hypothetical protein
MVDPRLCVYPLLPHSEYLPRSNPLLRMNRLYCQPDHKVNPCTPNVLNQLWNIIIHRSNPQAVPVIGQVYLFSYSNPFASPVSSTGSVCFAHLVPVSTADYLQTPGSAASSQQRSTPTFIGILPSQLSPAPAQICATDIPEQHPVL